MSGAASAQTSLDATLKSYSAKYELPALAAAVVKDGKLIAVGAVGTRRLGTDIPVTLDDRFHIGSDTKAMTALLCAMLVDEGRLRWNSTMAELYPELAATMDARLKTVTVEQLLSHTGGLPADSDELWSWLIKSIYEDGNLDDTRYWLVKQISAMPLPHAPGEKMVYSNLGYTVAGAIAERISGKTWEELMVERIFTPLGLRSAGLGPQSSPGKADAPLGHQEIAGKIVSLLAASNGDVPAVYGPAGVAHMSVRDFANWADWNAGQGKRGPALVKPATLKKLHTMVTELPPNPDAAPGTPGGGKYGLGWGSLNVDWAPYPILYHGGSNGRNLAHIWVDPQRDMAMVVMSNIATRKANEAFFALAPELYKQYGK
jgi:CubicO group peptidase (beta-lactamase class C family)